MRVDLVVIHDMQKVCVIGLGYVGFPLLCAIEKSGKYATLGFDISEAHVQKIRDGICPVDDEIAANDLAEIGSVDVTTDQTQLADSNIYIICVPTPVDDGHNPDLGPVLGASRTVAQHLQTGDIVIIESTINPGICEEVVLPVLEEVSGLQGGTDFHLGHCPERINPGDPVWNVYNIPRNVGALTPVGCTHIANFYRSFINAEINEMATITEAESTKIIENTFRDVNIAFVNELAQSFDKMGINLVNVINGAKNKPFAFLAHYPGCGVGGHCIAVDPYYLIEKAQQVGFDHQFLKWARKVNSEMPMYTVQKLVQILNTIDKAVKGSKIAVLGLSYKANVGDKRESPALDIIKILREQYHCDPYIFDPHFPEDNTFTTLDETLYNSDACIIATNHREFIEYDYKRAGLFAIVDGRNCLDMQQITDSHIVYAGIGVSSMNQNLASSSYTGKTSPSSEQPDTSHPGIGKLSKKQETNS